MQSQTTVIHCDNISTIKFSKNSIMHGRCKHIDVCFHFLRSLTKSGTIKMLHCGTQEQMVDIMTKPLKLDTFFNYAKVNRSLCWMWYKLIATIQFKGEFFSILRFQVHLVSLCFW